MKDLLIYGLIGFAAYKLFTRNSSDAPQGEQTFAVDENGNIWNFTGTVQQGVPMAPTRPTTATQMPADDNNGQLQPDPYTQDYSNN